MSGGEAAAVEDAAEPQYVDARTSVWWDIENCQVPRGCDGLAIARNINSALSKMGYRGQVSISAYGDTSRIPLAVQQSLSSTGIALNHVPAGVKAAGDEKILVDMLFWAIDNHAPANYLLISGDRDFSYALHQLRLRRYNILLAQPNTASPALVSAAKSIWFWSSLVTGGAPIPKNVSAQLMNVNSQFNPEAIQNYSSEPTHAHQSVVYQPDIPAAANQKLMSPMKVGNGDPKYREKYVKKHLNQPNMEKAHSTQRRVQDYNYQSGNALSRAHKKAPHEFFRPNGDAISTNRSAPNNFPVNPDPSAINVKEAGKQESQYPSHNRTRFTPMHFNPVPGKMIKSNPAFHSKPVRPHTPPLSLVSPTSSLDIGKLSISDYLNDAQRPLNLSQQTGEVSKLNSIENSNPESKSSLGTNPDIYTNVPPCHNPSNIPPPEFSSGSPFPTHANVPSNPGVYEAEGLSPLPSEYELELLGPVLDALDRLKKEKISPTEANIADCICFGNLKNRNIDVRKALDVAMERQMVIRHTLGGGLQLYVSKGQNIWKCINPEGGQPNHYSKAIWEKIQQFLITSSGQSAIVASSCKYEAAVNLKQLCLQDLPLGDVIRIINILAGPKRWIKHKQSGWQPVTITVIEAPAEASQEAAS